MSPARLPVLPDGGTVKARSGFLPLSVKIAFYFAIVALLISGVAAPASPRKKAARGPSANKAEIEAATRLQIFLDRANFSPGKIDGHYGDFTWKALALYRESRGEEPQTPPPQGKRKSHVAPDVNGACGLRRARGESVD